MCIRIIIVMVRVIVTFDRLSISEPLLGSVARIPMQTCRTEFWIVVHIFHEYLMIVGLE